MGDVGFPLDADNIFFCISWTGANRFEDGDAVEALSKRENNLGGEVSDSIEGFKYEVTTYSSASNTNKGLSKEKTRR